MIRIFQLRTQPENIRKINELINVTGTYTLNHCDQFRCFSFPKFVHISVERTFNNVGIRGKHLACVYL